MTQHDGTRLPTQALRQASRQAVRQAARQASRQVSGELSGLPRPTVGTRAAADLLAEHLIEAYRHAAACEDPVALDLIRLALWHVARTYPPSGVNPAPEEHWS
ncbi:hypothetical protein FF100_32495 [Methylobacterium terricola]|uniref:Uncharacterized protein n=1 Tax=Methylobacterium terricola TaxID=2583531 RepID=A0A5C4L8Q2_9HYPH|nr:hypothetical protein [Methylobacterium terricola]TNC07466.1 hypothetical protein FF100_32495 [Methylobacterium terricola]